jgi:hypothetical protein
MVRHTVRSWHNGPIGRGISTQTASDITLSRLLDEIIPLLVAISSYEKDIGASDNTDCVIGPSFSL